MKNRYRILPWLAILMLQHAADTKAQTRVEGRLQSIDLIRSENATPNLNPAANLRLATLKRPSFIKDVSVVRLPEALHLFDCLDMTIERNSQKLGLSSNGTPVYIKRTSIEILSETEIAWMGTIFADGFTDMIGEAVLIQNRDGQITGTIDIEGNFFRIRSLGQSDLHAIVMVDPKDRTSDHGDVEIPSKHVYGKALPAQIPDISITNVRCSPNFIDILVLYTPNAANGRDINGIISLAITEANQAYVNSNSQNVRVRVAHKQLINFSETTAIGTDLNWLKGSSSVLSLRNQYNADLVVLLTDGPYGNISGAASAILANENTAFAITQVDYATGGYYTFAHEVGHLQGAQHHPDDPIDPNGPFSHGFGHRFSYSCGFLNLSTCRRATIMARRSSPNNHHPYARVVRFSNPNLNYSGVSTGVAGQRENFSVLSATSATLADFRNPNELGGQLIAMPINSTTVDFSAYPCGGSGSYGFEWRYSPNDPYNYGNVVSTSQQFSDTFAQGYWYVQLKISTSTGQHIYKHAFFYSVGGDSDCTDPSIPCGPLKELTRESDADPLTTKIIATYPNPFNPTTILSYQMIESDVVEIALFDLNGKEIRTLFNGNKSEGMHQISINGDHLSSGKYLVRLRTSKSVDSAVITLVK